MKTPRKHDGYFECPSCMEGFDFKGETSLKCPKCGSRLEPADDPEEELEEEQGEGDEGEEC